MSGLALKVSRRVARGELRYERDPDRTSFTVEAMLEPAAPGP